MNDTQIILALEDVELAIRALARSMPRGLPRAELTAHGKRLERLTDAMRATSMKAGPPIHHATPKGSGFDANGSPC